MTPQAFIAKWQRSTLSERSACHEHFLDLCRVLDQPTPAEADPEGSWYTFEKGVKMADGGQDNGKAAKSTSFCACGTRRGILRRGLRLLQRERHRC